eukprot:s387_g16.t1
MRPSAIRGGVGKGSQNRAEPISFCQFEDFFCKFQSQNRTSTEGNGSSPSDAAMAHPVTLPISNSPFSVDISTPPASDKSRSLRERRSLPPLQNAVAPSHVGFNHRGFVPEAPREGGPMSRSMNQWNVTNHFQENVHVDNPQVNFVNQSVHLHFQDPAMTSLVEATAEIRHREILIQAESRAQAMHDVRTEELVEALRAHESNEQQRVKAVIQSNEDVLNREGHLYRETIKHEAQEHIRLQQAHMHEKVQAYQRVVDANHRQSISNKEMEIQELKRKAEEDRRVQNVRITQLEQLVQTQMQHNLKLQSMIDSQLAQARPAPIVETATEVLPPRTTVAAVLSSQTAKASAAPPPLRPNAPSLMETEFGVIGPSDHGDDNGNGDDGDKSGRDGKDDKKGNGKPGGDPPNPPDPPRGSRDKKDKKDPKDKKKKKSKGSNPPDDDGDDGDDGGNSDDSDEKFRKRMIKFLGGSFESKSDDKPKIKEADTIKIPGFPLAETYRNWRIKTREAVVAASTDPDKAFEWISETWKESQTLEALRKVAPFATLDAKLLSALTNIITGDFGRKVDTFKETKATAGRIVRGRQVLFMLHDHFSTNIKHGATYALQDLFSVQLRGDNLKSFISNWDQVLAGITQIPDESVLETLFYKQVKNCKAIQHDMNEYHRAIEGDDKRTYNFLVSAVRRHLDRERLEANRDRVAKGLSGAGRPSAPAVEGKTGFIPKGYCVAWNKGSCTKDSCTHNNPPSQMEKSKSLEMNPSKLWDLSLMRLGQLSVDADREVEPPVEQKSRGSSSHVQDDNVEEKRSLGEKALREEAKSIQHMLTHIPKNPYCDICQRAKMFKPPSYAVGGSTKVEAENFGDHITADFLVTRDEEEVGIDDEKTALVVKDVATGFMYVYYLPQCEENNKCRRFGNEALCRTY